VANHAALERVWELASRHVSLSTTPRLYVFPGQPPDGSFTFAYWYVPGSEVHYSPEHPFDRGQRDDANDPAHRNLHRVSVFAGVGEAEVAAKVVHELDHARQWDEAGPESYHFGRDVHGAQGRRFGGFPGGGAVYQLVPTEDDANSVASAFIRSHYTESVEGLLAGKGSASLVRPTDPPGEAETLITRLVCFAALYPNDLIDWLNEGDHQLTARLRDLPGDQVSLWRDLVSDSKLEVIRARRDAEAPVEEDLHPLSREQRWDRWLPVREALTDGMARAKEIAGIP
jgi:hypothetical protein